MTTRHFLTLDGGLREEDAGGDAGGGAAPTGGDWMSGLSEEVRTEAAKTGYKDPAQFVEGYLGLQRKLGASISVPHAESSPDDHKAFRERLASVDGVAMLPQDGDAEGLSDLYGKLGRPDDAAKYAAPDLDMETAVSALGQEGAQQFAQARSELLDHFRPVFHAANLTQAQVTALMSELNAIDMVAIDETAKASQASREMLERHVGNEEQVAAASARLDRLAATVLASRPDLQEQLKAEIDPRGRPATFYLLHQMAQQTMEDSGVVGGNGAPSAGETRFQVEQELTAIMGNSQHAYWTGRRGEPAHDQAVQKVLRLQEALARMQGQPEFVAN